MQVSLIDLMDNLNISQFKQPNIVPFEGIQGKWIRSTDFVRNKKSFGYYQCNYCQKTWMSAHSKNNFKQGCKQCDRFFYPIYMWKNTSEKIQKDKKPLKDNQKPHIKHLCQACKKGRCNE